FIGIVTLNSSIEEEDVACATVYVNTTEENWVASSELALFNPADRIQIAIKWTNEGFSQVIFNEGEGHQNTMFHILTIISTMLLAIASCCGVVFLVLAVRMMRRTVSTVEVQLAQVLSKDEADNVDMLEFDIGKVVRMFANDIAKDFANNGN
ncbi:hypothetical protein V1506DRAFT_444819, partial [Lipomyces tetrasporus]